MKKIAILLMFITVLSKITGFLRDITLSYFYGTTSTSDVYIISTTITTVLFSLIITGISTAYIPLYKQIEISSGTRSATKFTNNILNIVLIMTSIVIIIGLLFTDYIVKVFAFGFEGETFDIAIQFTRIGLAGLFFSSVTKLLMSYLQVNGRFIASSLIGLPYNFVIIASIYISSYSSIYILAIGTIVASLAQLILLIPSLVKSKFRFEPVLNFQDQNVKMLAMTVGPIMIGISIDQINMLVDKTLASTIIEGGISALTYGSRLTDFVQGIFVFSFVTVMFPFISKLAANKEMKEFKKSIREVMNCVLLIVVPSSVGIMMLAEPIIRLLFGRGEFDGHAITHTTHALFFYSIGMIGYGFREVLLRVFYSLQNQKIPLFNALFSVILNTLLSIILSNYMGINGLALATSLVAIFSSFLLLSSLKRKIGNFGLVKILITTLKALLASTAMGFVIFIMYHYIPEEWNQFFRLGMIFVGGSCTYFIAIYLLKVHEVKLMTDFLMNVFKKHKGLTE